jgi:hypothetical protein
METSKLPISEEQLIETVRRYSNLYDLAEKTSWYFAQRQRLGGYISNNTASW